METAASKPPTKTSIAKARHAAFKAVIAAYWAYRNPGTEMPWGVEGGRSLEIWLRDHPDVDIYEFRQWLRYRARSAVDHSEHPAKWIGGIGFFVNGPLNRYYERGA